MSFLVLETENGCKKLPIGIEHEALAQCDRRSLKLPDLRQITLNGFSIFAKHALK